MAANHTTQVLKDCEALWSEQQALCDVLERIADSLPAALDRKTCVDAAQALPEIIGRAHRFEEEVLFDALDAAESVELDLRPMLKRLREEHAGDEFFAEELSEALLSFAETQPLHSPETTGYMLRGFFQTLRRHIALEQELTRLLLGPISH